MIIEKKIWPDFFNLVENGEKTFEYRLADWEAKEGDTLVLKEWNPKTKDYTGREITKQIGYVLNLKDVPDFHSEEEKEKYGFMIISLKD
jgi:hypothetical protein